jgi:hypothetical protein
MNLLKHYQIANSITGEPASNIFICNTLMPEYLANLNYFLKNGCIHICTYE